MWTSHTVLIIKTYYYSYKYETFFSINFVLNFFLQMSGKRSHSFKCAVHHRDREVCSENDFHILFEQQPLFQR